MSNLIEKKCKNCGTSYAIRDETWDLHECENKFILDVCCGGKCFWFNKNHSKTIYIDIRKEEKGHFPHRPNHNITPDFIMDFRDLKFPDKKFKMVIFDPPHLKCGMTGFQGKTYGSLNQFENGWEIDLKKGFEECWRVLDDYGTLIFKWNSSDVPVNKLIELFRKDPIVGHTTGSKSKTHWISYMKIPKQVI